LDSKKQTELVKYLNSQDFRDTISGTEPGRAVDVAAEHIQAQGWSAFNKKRDTHVKPTSLVSKVAFFIRPKALPPMDSLSKRGLNRTRGTKKAKGEGHQKFDLYAEYLTEFNLKYGHYKAAVRVASEAPWVKPLTTALGGNTEILQTEAFTRKVFDSVLMRIGRRIDKAQ
jgi:hypothetical protein